MKMAGFDLFEAKYLVRKYPDMLNDFLDYLYQLRGEEKNTNMLNQINIRLLTNDRTVRDKNALQTYMRSLQSNEQNTDRWEELKNKKTMLF